MWIVDQDRIFYFLFLNTDHWIVSLILVFFSGNSAKWISAVTDLGPHLRTQFVSSSSVWCPQVQGQTSREQHCNTLWLTVITWPEPKPNLILTFNQHLMICYLWVVVLFFLVNVYCDGTSTQIFYWCKNIITV